jgi:squalene cyclase
MNEKSRNSITDQLHQVYQVKHLVETSAQKQRYISLCKSCYVSLAETKYFLLAAYYLLYDWQAKQGSGVACFQNNDGTHSTAGREVRSAQEQRTPDGIVYHSKFQQTLLANDDKQVAAMCAKGAPRSKAKQMIMYSQAWAPTRSAAPK